MQPRWAPQAEASTPTPAPGQAFVGECIEVVKAETTPTPLSFTWRGQSHAVAKILDQWVDAGYGPGHPARSRRWYTRRHRRYFVVRDQAGDAFEIYLDYADREHRSWWLVRHTPAPAPAADG